MRSCIRPPAFSFEADASGVFLFSTDEATTEVDAGADTERPPVSRDTIADGLERMAFEIPDKVHPGANYLDGWKSACRSAAERIRGGVM